MNNIAEVSNPADTGPVAVLGAGTWGITLACVLAQNGHAVRCWDIDGALLARLDAERRHPRLEKMEIPATVAFEPELGRALHGTRAATLVIPSHAMRSALGAIGRDSAGIGTWVIATKGIEDGTLMLMHEVLTDVLGEAAGARACVLSGPSHAEEVSLGLPTTIVASAADPALAARVQELFFRPYLRVYTHDDMRGVELGGSIKYVIAIASGVCGGLGLGDNTRAALITRGLAEIVRLGLACGARLETFIGLSGVGDLVVTATSHHSRNYRFGELLAANIPADEALRQIGMVVEGYHTARSARSLARRHQVEMPIVEAVAQVLFEGVSPRQALEDLLARDPKPEHY